ncbi:MAG: SEL1-like repeat protein [Polyangiaceae bacterium]
MSKRRGGIVLGLAWVAAWVISACGADIPKKLVLPPPPPPPEEACDIDHATPLIVDWMSHQRSDLEEVMGKGVAVVSYDCKTLKVLADCRAVGNYGYMGMTKKEDVFQLVDTDEIRANLPTTGVKLSAELERDAALDLALITVGKQRSLLRSIERVALEGDCTGATHFVRGAYLGAFAMQTGTRGKLSAAAELFGAGLAGATQSSKTVRHIDGDLKRCTQAQAGSSEPPPECRSLIRLELKKLGEPTRAVADRVENASQCPKDMVVVGGKCTARRADVAHVCQPSDPADCKAQCEKGDMQSCSFLAYMHHYGAPGVEVDFALARALYERSCNGDIPDSCAGLGILYQHALGVPRDVARGHGLQVEACEAGNPRGCNNLGVDFEKGHGTPRDLGRAIELYKRSCAAGYAAGCANLAIWYRNGAPGMPRDIARAIALNRAACDSGGSPQACRELGRFYERGDGVPRDFEKALALFERACKADGRKCTSLGTVYERGLIGREKDLAKAVAYFKRACDVGEPQGCNDQAVYVGRGLGTPRDPALAVRLLQKSCDASYPLGCANLANWYERGGPGLPRDPARAEQLRRAACATGRAPTACRALQLQAARAARAAQSEQDDDDDEVESEPRAPEGAAEPAF